MNDEYEHFDNLREEEQQADRDEEHWQSEQTNE